MYQVNARMNCRFKVSFDRAMACHSLKSRAMARCMRARKATIKAFSRIPSRRGPSSSRGRPSRFPRNSSSQSWLSWQRANSRWGQPTVNRPPSDIWTPPPDLQAFTLSRSVTAIFSISDRAAKPGPKRAPTITKCAPCA
jgi:hypothetical protein